MNEQSDQPGKTAPQRAWHPTYKSEYRRCGKPYCHCMKSGDKGHGPYWYAYWHAGGKMHSRYIGRTPPPGMEPPV